MALQFSIADRTAFAAQLVAAIGGGTIKWFTGAEPANCAAGDPAGLVATGTLPGTAATAASGVLTKSGTWTLTGSGAGTAISFRIYDTAGSPACRIQGSVGLSGTDMTADNNVVANAQVVTVNSFAITFANG
jgi:hypothetical protein